MQINGMYIYIEENLGLELGKTRGPNFAEIVVAFSIRHIQMGTIIHTVLHQLICILIVINIYKRLLKVS